MRTYGQWCSMTKALDVIGDRWALLVARELLLQGPCRFTDLRNGLPGIASNLLSTRLKDLETSGIIRREAAPAPVATTLYNLTEVGRGLQPVIEALTIWGVQFKHELYAEEEFRSHWLTYPITWVLEDSRPDEPPASIQLIAADQPVLLEVAAGHIHVRPGITQPADLTITGHPDAIMGLFLRRVPLTDATAPGLTLTGDTAILDRVIRTTPHPALASMLPS